MTSASVIGRGSPPRTCSRVPRVPGAAVFSALLRYRSLRETAPQFEVLAMGGLQCLVEVVHFVAVASFEVGELGGEGAGDAAGLVRVGPLGWRGGRGLVLGAWLRGAAGGVGGVVEGVHWDARGRG